MSGHRKWVSRRKGKELEPYCSWPFHLDRQGNDLEAAGCPSCFWWSICYWLSVANVDVVPPMSRR